LNHLASHFLVEWKERIIHDGMFDDDPVETWNVNNDNAIEFLDAINLNEYFDVKELKTLILTNDQKDEEGLNFVYFVDLVHPLMKICLLELNLTIDELFNFDE